MRSLIAISTLIITFSINAKELQVQDLNLIYKLSFDQNHIRYEAQEISLSLVHQKCSEHIIKRFNEKMDFILKMPEIKIQNENTFTLIIDKKTSYRSKFSNEAQFLLSMNNEIKKLKIEELLNCKKM